MFTLALMQKTITNCVDFLFKFLDNSTLFSWKNFNESQDRITQDLSF